MKVLLCFKTDSLSGKLMLKQVLKIISSFSIPASTIRKSSLLEPASQFASCWDPIVGTVNSSNSGNGKN